MSIPYRTQPNPNRPEQIRLFVRCASEVQAEALWRALRERFAWVSNPLPSFDPSFSNFFFVATSAEELSAAWPELAAAAARATASSGSTGAPQPVRRSTAQLSDLATWDQRFREAVRRVHAEIPQQSTATQEVSLGWVVEQVRAGNAEAVEALLNQPLINPTSGLRAQIALFSETGQHERLIALVESRRREVLALPVSGLLAEQIVGAYLEFGRASLLEDALRGAQQIAQALLPELERLQQAEGVREQLRQAREPLAPPLEVLAPTLREQIAGIVQVAPAEQIAALEALRCEHVSAVEIQLALGAAYAAAGQLDAALDTYSSATAHDDAERSEVSDRRAELLIEAGRYREALELLPPAEEAPAGVALLRGVALYWLGRAAEAHELLEQSWEAGEHRRALLLPLARGRAAIGQDDRALQVYRLLLDNAPDLLEVEDIARIVLALYMDRPEDIPPRAIAELGDAYVQQGGPLTRPAQEIADILRLRIELWAGEDRERWIGALADHLEWLALQGASDKLQNQCDLLRESASLGHLERREHFEILETAEVGALDSEALRGLLSNEYQSICTGAIDKALLRNEPIPAFVQAMQRSLHFLDRAAADFIIEYIDDERAQLARRNLEATEQIFAAEESASLASLRLTIVGGHTRMRDEVKRELRDRYGLRDLLEVPPSSEAHIDRDLVRDRTVGRDLIVVVAGYSGHDLTNHVRDLLRTGEIAGLTIWPKCRGKSGVVREIVASSTRITS